MLLGDISSRNQAFAVCLTRAEVSKLLTDLVPKDVARNHAVIPGKASLVVYLVIHRTNNVSRLLICSPSRFHAQIQPSVDLLFVCQSQTAHECVSDAVITSTYIDGLSGPYVDSEFWQYSFQTLC